MKKLKIHIMIIFFVFLQFPVIANATQTSVTFGSLQYYEEVDRQFNVGVYFRSEVDNFKYEVALRYDPTKIQYLYGADWVEYGVLYFSGTSDTSEQKYMLGFQALTTGNTDITVEAAWFSTDELELSINEIGLAPITISTTELTMDETLLEHLTMEELDSFEFSPLRFLYNIEVANEIKELNIEAIPINEEAVIEINQNDLEVGLNQIEIDVLLENSIVQQYVLLVQRLEAVPVEQVEDAIVTTPSIVETPPVTVETPSIVEEEVEAVTSKDAIPTEIEIGILLFLISIGIMASIVIKMKYFKHNEISAYEGKDICEDEFVWIDLDHEEKDRKEIIRMDNVTMNFKINESNVGSLKEFVIKTIKKEHVYRNLIALNKIDLSIKQGEIIGLIGTNGSGKSTLLKIISGVLNPTDGRITVDHSKVQLLTLGTGFDTELTARENVYLNGAMVGYSKEFLNQKYDDIVKFAELEGFMEEKIKNFSSGMVSRLAFAIATVGDSADILILDEVLSVGDMFFRKKSEKRIKEMIRSGATVLIVSHSTDTIIKNCTKAVWIEKGHLMEIGNPVDVCKSYKEFAH